jgi:hypothetical protein
MQYTSAVDGKTRQVLTHHHYPKSGTPWATMAAQMLTWSEDGWPVLAGTLFDPMDYWGKKK